MNTRWTEDEDHMLYAAVSYYDNWRDRARCIPSRTVLAVTNRYHALQNKNKQQANCVAGSVMMLFYNDPLVISAQFTYEIIYLQAMMLIIYLGRRVNHCCELPSCK